MDLIILSFLTASGKIWVIAKLIGMTRLIRWSKWFDIFFLFALPLMFLGTFSGAILAVLSGLWFTAITWFFGLFVSKKPNEPMPDHSINKAHRR